MISTLPSLLEGKSTRDTLHRYSKVAGAVRRSLSPPHPRWWHISLAVYEDGLTTAPIEVRDQPDIDLELRLNLRQHRFELRSGSEQWDFDLQAGLTATDLGDRVVSRIRELGIEAGIDGSLYADDSEPSYAPKAAEEYLSALVWIDRNFRSAAREIGGDLGPVQLWPHHFDLSFEWFGCRIVPPEEGAEGEGSRAQIGFGFSLGDDSVSRPYFYANPWPFDSAVTSDKLPEGASWFQDGWKGALLPYREVCEAGEARLSDLIKTVHAIASPRLNA